VSHGEVGGLALGDGVEDDGGEVGHEVRRLAAQGRQVPHRFPPYGPTPTRSAAAKFGRRSSAPGASGAALGWVGEPEKAEPASGGVASRGDERIWTCSVVGLDWIFGSLLFFSDVVALSAAVSG